MNTVSVERSSLGSSSLCVNTVYDKMKTKRSVVKILASIGSSFKCALQFFLRFTILCAKWWAWRQCRRGKRIFRPRPPKQATVISTSPRLSPNFTIFTYFGKLLWKWKIANIDECTWDEETNCQTLTFSHRRRLTKKTLALPNKTLALLANTYCFIHICIGYCSSLMARWIHRGTVIWGDKIYYEVYTKGCDMRGKKKVFKKKAVQEDYPWRGPNTNSR